MDRATAWRSYHRLRIERAASNFEARGFTTRIYESGAEAADFFFGEIAAGETVGYGGSDTVQDLGIRDRLRSANVSFISPLLQ